MSESQRPYFRVQHDEFYSNLSDETKNREFDRLNEPRGTATVLKRFHRTRTLVCWHDTSAISNASHLLIMFATMYDPAVFYTDEEYFEKTGNNLWYSIIW